MPGGMYDKSRVASTKYEKGSVSGENVKPTSGSEGFKPMRAGKHNSGQGNTYKPKRAGR